MTVTVSRSIVQSLKLALLFVALACAGCGSSKSDADSDPGGSSAGLGGVLSSASGSAGVSGRSGGTDGKGGKGGKGSQDAGAPGGGDAGSADDTGGSSDGGEPGDGGTGGGSVAGGGTSGGAGGGTPSGGTGGGTPPGPPVPAVTVWQWGQADHEGALASDPWQVDNAQSHFEGNTAVHPPALKADVPADLTLSCGDLVHTELTFRVYRPGAGTLTLLVDGVERQALTAYNNQWTYYVFNVPQKKHVYTFRAQSSADAASSFALDSFACRNGTPVVNADQKVDFDQSYIPPETGGGWFVDNALGLHPDGTDTGYETAIHPPALKADKPVDLTFNCGDAVHSQLTFMLYRPGGGALTLLVDGVERQALTAYNNQWTYYVFDVEQKKHVYTFRASSSADVGSSFVLDTLRCRNITPVVNADQKVDFDQSYVPPETGGGWLVDNALGLHPDGTDTGYEAAIHPPALKADKPVDLTFNCGDAVHSQLTFMLYRPGGGALTLLVDGVERQALTAYNNQWTYYVFDVEQKKHVYTFRVSSSADVGSSFVLDTLRCRNITPVVNADQKVDFDQSYIPPETGGGWFVDNALGLHPDGTDTGYEAAIHPPALKADKPVDLTFNCGDAVHTELTFMLYRPGGGALTLLVDGVERQSLTAYNNQWTYYVFNVEQKKHVYTFRASSSADVGSSFVLDTLRCRNITPVANADHKVDFDQGFVPPETGGGWFADNALGLHPDGTDTGYEAAIHPPALKADKPVDLTFNCGGAAHTELDFQLYRPGAGTLTLLVDGAVRQTLTAYNNQWSPYAIVSASAAHVYTFRVQSSVDAGSSFVLDTLVCK